MPLCLAAVSNDQIAPLQDAVANGAGGRVRLIDRLRHQRRIVQWP